MNSPSNFNDSSKHQRFVETLAEEMNQPVEKVEMVYDEILAELIEEADIADFVPVFAYRKARARLDKR